LYAASEDRHILALRFTSFCSHDFVHFMIREQWGPNERTDRTYTPNPPGAGKKNAPL